MTMLTPWKNRQAAEHFLALQDDEAHPDAIFRALQWVDQNENNRAEFDRIQRFWIACESVAIFAPEADLPNTNSRTAPRLAAFMLVAASLVAALVGIVHYQGLFRPEARAISYVSAVGETRVLNLPDRSQIILGGASAITVRYDDDVRNVILNDGEALFNVARDKNRPFLVDSGAGSIRAVGTSFNVHRGHPGTTVTVVHGAVEIKSRSIAGPVSGLLKPGMQLSYAADGKITSVQYVDPAQVISWKSGVLKFSGEPLTAVLADLNRYSLRPILIDSPQVGLVEITGTVRTDGIEDWLSGLASAAGLEIVDSDPGVIRLRIRVGSDPQHGKSPANFPITNAS